MPRIQSGKQLLKSLSENPALPAFVPSLPATGLKKLIDKIGLEDAGSLIEFSTTAQLVAVLDESIWTNAAPGTPETFDPEEFLRWLEAMLEVGDEFAAERLQALSDELLVTALSYYLQVQDHNMIFREPQEKWDPASTAEMVEFYGRFQVSPHFDDEWDILLPTLNAMHLFDQDWLQAILTRCFPPGGLLNSRDTQTAMSDAAAEHEHNREQQGYITPISAQSFLQLAKDTSVAELLSLDCYDIDAADYFKRASTNKEPEAVAGNHTRLSHDDGANDEDDPLPVVDPGELQSLHDLLTAIELDEAEASLKQLSGPTSNGSNQGETTLAIQQALDRLATDNSPGLDQCMQELGYLSNIVIMGAALDGKRLSQKDAASAVLATCNLGLETCPDTPLEKEPGLISLFQIGWHLIQQLPATVLSSLITTLESKSINKKLGIRSWLLSDIIKDLKNPRFRADLALGKFEAIHDTLQMLALVLDEEACHALTLFIADFPCTIDLLTPERQSRKFISTREDLALPVQFCRNIQGHLKMKKP